MLRTIAILLLLLLLSTACVAGGSEPAAADLAPTPTLDPDDPLVQDAARYAADLGISVDEAVRRLGFQDDIGALQQTLATDLPDTFGGLWVEHAPAYRILIALTSGDATTVAPYVDGRPWAAEVTVVQVAHSYATLLADQQQINEAAQQIGVPVTSYASVQENRVIVEVGNPQLLADALAAAGLALPETVLLRANRPDQPPPDSNRGRVDTAVAADGRTLYLPQQAPTASSMQALMENTLVEDRGCLRVDGFLVIWPYGSTIHVDSRRIEIRSAAGDVVGIVGQRIRMAGGAVENQRGYANVDAAIDGMPLVDCPGPYWIAGELESMDAQAVANIWVNPFSVDGEILLILLEQSRPAEASGEISGTLAIDADHCLRVAGYALLLPPQTYARENPLRLVDADLARVAAPGDVITVTGSEKTAADYRFFENKVPCAGPYWGAAALVGGG